MFREHTQDPSGDFSWQWTTAAPSRTLDPATAFVDPTGELSPVYREIARRIARNAFTTHVSTLGLGAA